MLCPGCLTGKRPKRQTEAYVSLLQSLPLVYSSLGDHQKKDPFCVDLRAKIQAGQGVADGFQVFKDLLCYYTNGDKDGVL
jgi:hypothetical protein